MIKNPSQRLAWSALLVALGVVLSPLSIPLGFARCFPMQHLINVLAALSLGPVYSLLVAFAISLIRNLMGTGSLLAFPGSLVGALLAGLLVQRVHSHGHKLSLAFAGELVGTGIFGALLAYPVAKFVLGKEAALFGFVVPFLISSLVGAALAILLALALERVLGPKLGQRFN